jgi:hypothetical protein
MSTADRAAIFMASSEFLRSMLCLPDGAEIDAVQVDVDRPGVLLFRIRGAGWPVHNGATIPRATCQIRQRTMCDGEGFVMFVERIEWDFPKC